jgi:RNA recognition motif-containing protein
MKIFIGSLSYNVTEEDLRHAFEAFGQVASATVIKDEQSGRSKGFGFVEMPVQAEAQSAIAAFGFKICRGCDILAYHKFPVLVILSNHNGPEIHFDLTFRHKMLYNL